MITIKRTNNKDKDFKTLVAELDKDLRSRYGTMQLEYDQYNVIENLETVVVVYHDNKPAGCGCFKRFNPNSAEIKRMFVSGDKRCKGIGALIMAELENWAAGSGFEYTVLETGYEQPEAIHLYKKQGYVTIPNYGPYIGNEEFSICMQKRIN
jgi:GNAT superfamily N-acetyltransferase